MSERPHPIVVKGPLDDLGDLLSIARVQGKIALKAKRVKVKPVVFPFGDHYLVLVEPEKDGSGCSKASDVGGRKKT